MVHNNIECGSLNLLYSVYHASYLEEVILCPTTPFLKRSVWLSRTFRWKISPLVIGECTLSELSTCVVPTRTIDTMQPVTKQTCTHITSRIQTCIITTTEFLLYGNPADEMRCVRVKTLNKTREISQKTYNTNIPL